MTGRALVAQADALRIPLRDESVDLAVFSPPYFALRSYGIGCAMCADVTAHGIDPRVAFEPSWDDHVRRFHREIGSEATPAEFLAALWQVMGEVKRVLKPGGSIFVNLGDKYAGPATGATPGSTLGGNAQERNRLLAGGLQSQRGPRPAFGARDKSLLGLPWAFALGCTGMLAALTQGLVPIEVLKRTFRPHMTQLDLDIAFASLAQFPGLAGPDPPLDLIWRAEIIWQKVNGLPESVRDRVRRSHEVILHFTKEPRYYAAVDEVREPHARLWGANNGGSLAGGSEYTVNNSVPSGHRRQDAPAMPHPLGKLPGSVLAIPSEPLDLPGYFVLRDGRLLDFLAPSRGGARPRPNGHHPGLFDADAYREVIASGDGPAWRWSRAVGVTSSPWPQQDGGLQLRVAASHYAAFPSRLPELIVRGWSPPGICVECDQGRWPVVDRQRRPTDRQGAVPPAWYGQEITGSSRGEGWTTLGTTGTATILGYACACTPFTDHPGTGEPSGPDGRYAAALEAGEYPNTMMALGHAGLGARPKVGPWREYHLAGWQAPPTRPAVVLDPFGGTGTTALVARTLGRRAYSFDLSFPYCRAADWRIHHSGNAGKALARTWAERQGTLA